MRRLFILFAVTLGFLAATIEPAGAHDECSAGSWSGYYYCDNTWHPLAWGFLGGTWQGHWVYQGGGGGGGGGGGIKISGGEPSAE